MYAAIFRFRKPTCALLFTMFVLASCTKDESTNTQKKTETDISARLTAKKLYEEFYMASASSNSDTPWTGDEPSCNPGTVPQATKDKIFTRLAYFRRAVGLTNDIDENNTKSEKAQKAALMMHSNGTLDHFPPESWKCFTTEGKDGAGNSLLTMSKNAEAIDSYIRDYGSENGPVGHRRWLLWPKLQEIGIGNTHVSNALWVLGNAGTPPSDAPEFIAWPPKGYVPHRLAYNRWSFSIDKADFNATQISMKDAKGNSVALEIEELVGIYGDNTIVWVPSINTNSITEDTAYTVKLKNVGIEGEMQDFEYEVILFDPND